MEEELMLALVLLPVLLLVAVVLGVIAFVKVGQLQQRVQQLEQRSVAAPPAPTTHVSTPQAVTMEVQRSSWVEKPSTLSAPTPTTVSSPPMTTTVPSTDSRAATTAEPALGAWLLRNLSEHWMVWLGGLCVGLAGIFMVRYSIENQLLSPETRLLLAAITGLALHGVAEWLRARNGSNVVFAALAGGASIILYASLLAAFKLPEPPTAQWIFVGMALVSLLTLWLALRHGPLLAALGLLGGYLVPVLVRTDAGQIESALIYSLILTFFALWLLAYVQRQWLWWGVVAGSLGWWLISFNAQPSSEIRTIYLCCLAYLFLAVPSFDWRLRWGSEPQAAGWLAVWLQSWREPQAQALWKVIAVIVLAQALTWAHEGVVASSYLALLVLPLLLAHVAYRRSEFNPLVAAVLLCTALATVLSLLVNEHGQWRIVPLEGVEQQALALRFLAIVALYVGVAWWWRRRAVPHPAFWLGLGCGAPLLLLACAYYLFDPASFNWVWGLVAALLGLSYAAVALKWHDQGRVVSQVVLFSAAHLGLALAAVIWLSDATLTLALAAQLVSLAYLQRRYGLEPLGWVIRAVLVLVVLRLTFNPWLLSYGNDSHWSLWTYGGATLCALAATWLLRHEQKMQAWLQGGAAQLLVLTLAVEVRYWLYDGEIYQSHFSFTEASIYVLAWGSVALLYQWRARLTTSLPQFYRWLAQAHGLAAALLYAGYLLLQNNPWWAHPQLGTTPIWNGLLLGYGLPTLLLLAVVWQAQPAGWSASHKRMAAVVAALNGWFFINLEIRQLWQQSDALQLWHSTSMGELYSYSAVWLVLAVGALLVSSWRMKPAGYRGGMLLLLVVVAKIFMVDMAGLSGLWRVASFMGLGLTLLALAWLHQRYGGRLQTQKTLS